MGGMDWRTQRQVTILAIAALVIFGMIASSYYAFLRVPATCADGRRNQGEAEVDCGGPCASCAFQHRKEVEVFYARFVQSRASVYDVAAEVQNPNDHLAVNPLAYRVRLFDDRGAEVGRRENVTFIYPSDKIYIVETGFFTERTAARAELTPLPDASVWVYSVDLRPDLIVGNKRYASTTGEGIPGARLTAEVTNRSVFGYNDVDIRAVLADSSQNVLAAAKTMIKKLKAGETRTVEMTWPAEPAGAVERINVEARANGLIRTNLLVQ
jgi:hypothetical protein